MSNIVVHGNLKHKFHWLLEKPNHYACEFVMPDDIEVVGGIGEITCPDCKEIYESFGISEPTQPDYTQARGITGWQEGDEPAEVTIRRQRDGDAYGLQPELDALRAENARLRRMLRVTLNNYIPPEDYTDFGKLHTDVIDAVREALGDE